MNVSALRKAMGGLTVDEFTPTLSEEDCLDSMLVDFCNRIGRRLRWAQFSIKEVRDIWKRSNRDSEALDILRDLTCLSKKELRFVLGEEEVPEHNGLSVTDTWLRQGSKSEYMMSSVSVQV